MRQLLPKAPQAAKTFISKVGQRARKLADQAGEKLGDISNFDQAKQTVTEQGIAAHNTHRSIQTIRQQLPAMFGLSALKGGKTLQRVSSTVIPNRVKDGMTEFSLDRLAQLAQYLSDTDLPLLHHDATTPRTLAQADVLADLIADRNRLLAAAEGGATGMFSLIGMLIDLPLSLIIALRTIYQTAECYGQDLSGEDGLQQIYAILASIDYSSVNEKQTVMAGLGTLNTVMARQGGIASLLPKILHILSNNPIAERVAKPVLTRVNAQTGFISRFLPIVGAVTGASYNTQMINSVAAVAQQVFRAAYEQQFGLESLVDPEELQPTPVSSASLNADVAALPADELVKGVFGATAAENAPSEQHHPEKTKVIRVTKTADGEIVPSGRD
ncbi:MAG: EcsC family protein [Pseudomonadota bacterium]|nr:EcsC family protein [Pseudomonadota bacterium]